MASSLHNLANLYRDQGKNAEADKFYQEALTVRTKALGEDHPQLVPLLENYAELLKKMKRSAQARELEERVKKIKAQAKVLAGVRGINCRTLDYEALRGLDDGADRLF